MSCKVHWSRPHIEKILGSWQIGKQNYEVCLLIKWYLRQVKVKYHSCFLNASIDPPRIRMILLLTWQIPYLAPSHLPTFKHTFWGIFCIVCSCMYSELWTWWTKGALAALPATRGELRVGHALAEFVKWSGVILGISDFRSDLNWFPKGTIEKNYPNMWI